MKRVLWASIFIAGSIELCFVGVVTSMSSVFSKNISVMGLTITLYSLSFTFFGPICMRAVKGINYKTIFIACLGIVAVGNILSIFTNNFYLFLLYRALIGTASSVLISKSLSLASELSSSETLNRNLGFLYTAFAGANTFAIPIFSYLGNKFSWKTIPLIIILISISIILAALFYIPKNYYGKENTNTQKKRTRLIDSIEPVKVLLTTVIILCSNMVFIGYLNPYMDKMGFMKSEITIALFIFGVGGILGSYISPYLTKKYSIKQSLILLLSVYALLLIVIQINHIKWAFFPLMFSWSIAQWATGPLLQNYLIKQTTTDKELFISLNVSAINIGSALGGLLGGIVISVVPLNFLPFCAMLTECFAFLLVLSYKGRIQNDEK